MFADDAVTVWLGRIQAGDAAAVTRLWDKYFLRLVGLARKRLRDSRGRVADEEDVALSAFDSFCRNAGAGRFPDLSDRDGVWRLLASFTARKVAHHVRDAMRRKRGGEAAKEGSDAIEAHLSREPDPALAVQVAEECSRLLVALGGSGLQEVALLRMDGYTIDEVADRIGCAPRTIKRKLRLIRTIWASEVDDEAG
jgi:DNA-directed RNA polymerase specialized sigma24 family protein